MPRRSTDALALFLLALAATFCGAKPPDLPEKLGITVVAAPMPADDGTCPACPDRHFRGSLGDLANRSVLDNLQRLTAAGDELEQAKDHAKAGELDKALACYRRAMQLAPGSNVADACAAEVVRACAFLRLDGFGKGGEQAAEDEGPVPGCCCEAFMRQFGLCWWSQAAKACEAACASGHGKAVMVDGLLKSAQLALGEGRTCKARELVRQAHALDPARVGADPLVYKMHLLPMKDELGGEQPCEPGDANPNQRR